MWLELLLAEEPAQALAAHRDRLLARGLPAEQVEREARAALQVRALLAQRRQRAAELSALNEIAGRLAGLHQPGELLREVTEQARRLLAVDLAYIGLVQGEQFVMEVASGALTPQLLGLRLPRAAGIAGAVVTGARPIWTCEYAAAVSFEHHPVADEVAAAENIRALLGVPLTVRGRVLGALFACKRQERHFTEEEVALLTALAAHAAVAIDNAVTLHRLNEANAELARTLGWDRQLTEVVLRGGGVDDLVAEVAASVAGQVRFLPGQERAEGEVVCTVRADRLVLGSLVLVGEQVCAGDRLLLERAAPVLALAVLRERAAAEASRLTRDTQVIDLLTRPAADGQRMRALGLDPSRPHCVLLTTPGTEPPRVPTGGVLARSGDRLVLVAPGESAEDLLAQWPPGRHTVGAAGPAANPGELARCYQEAEQTLDALLALGREGESCTAAQLGIYRVLLTHAGREQLHAEFERALGPVLAEQERRGVPLLDTVRAYLDSGGRAAAAAQALGVHVNTLYQRLGHLDALLGPGWREHPRALDLQVLLRVVPG
ncbi:helix-turn-helix domain-containing protein [Kutzneria albida]|uniref:GAF domain-containing protein n=1 Tax=Kutzneria albida DSM 43870 TaxID=1449976 RepID=W5WDZ0_9PSEU|nr:GAF domain-containing protein [Kutzneria albida]AHH99398.1 hypothetical protein KALB_6038 [Kutzneria albida DSM 43870]